VVRPGEGTAPSAQNYSKVCPKVPGRVYPYAVAERSVMAGYAQHPDRV